MAADWLSAAFLASFAFLRFLSSWLSTRLLLLLLLLDLLLVLCLLPLCRLLGSELSELAYLAALL